VPALFDVLGLLDGGWRIYSGQRVFNDFVTTPGALEDSRMPLPSGWVAEALRELGT